MAKIFNYVEVLKWAFPTMQEKELSPAECFLFLYFLHRENLSFWKNLNFSLKTIEKDTGISRRSLFQIKKKFLLLGLVEDVNGFKLNMSIFPEKKEERKEGTPARQLTDEDRIADVENFRKKSWHE